MVNKVGGKIKNEFSCGSSEVKAHPPTAVPSTWHSMPRKYFGKLPISTTIRSNFAVNVEISACINIMTDKNEKANGDPPRAPIGRRSFSDYFQLPAPVKRIFDKFPLKTYPPNDLPRRSLRLQDANVLHIFTTKQGAVIGAPSFNPACLKWQVRRNPSVGFKFGLTLP